MGLTPRSHVNRNDLVDIFFHRLNDLSVHLPILLDAATPPKPSVGAQGSRLTYGVADYGCVTRKRLTSARRRPET